MMPDIQRRQFIAGSALGLGGLLLPGFRASAMVSFTTGFTHNVASGEPGPDTMLLWTRYVPAGAQDSVHLQAEVAQDPAFARIVAGGSVRTGAYRDWTAKIMVDGLEPGTVYWYRFVAPDGTKSPTGRTRTLPVLNVDRFGLALFSCSNLPFGWFNAYAHAAARDDVDLWLHVGDYLYEYERGRYPSARNIVAGRVVEPAGEMIELADYRMRYACYRADPDLQRLHQIAPMIAQWDDHETANDSWEGGAENHQPATEGDWSRRRNASIQAFREWLPVSDEPWKSYPIGRLATLYRTESRVLARTRQIETSEVVRAMATPAAFEQFRERQLQDPSATMLGSVQESWLAHMFRANAKNSIWQIVGMGTNLGTKRVPEIVLDWLPKGSSAEDVAFWRGVVRSSQLGAPSWNMDAWDGYPAARARLLRAAQQADADLVMLTGDSHNAWAYSLAEDGRPAGVEFGGTSVTSPGMESDFTQDPLRVARELVAANPELQWADTSRRGYVMVEITSAAVSGEWIFMKTIRERTMAVSSRHRMSVDAGRRRFSA
ncbi:alkaline phosphatase D family protein [Sphingomonadaceae bacterium jetA1]|jgi:alkaline phosphatase D|uniref:alkaline phosphatase D family protein n=1 Tax=Facivitalis istanbulensis TaxID=3075838 RepID=UPI003481B1B1